MVYRIIIAKFFMAIVALQLLNMSIYTGEFENTPNATAKDCVEETETLVEFIVEKVENKNLDADTQNDDNKEAHPYKDFQVKLFPPTILAIKIAAPLNTHKLTHGFVIHYDYLFYKEINPPPPKVVTA